MSNVIERLRAISIAPSREGGALESWIEQNDAIGFLKDNLSDQEFVLYEPLGRLKYILDQLRSQGVPWWTLRSEELVQRVHYPVTKSSEEWADELMALDKLLVEGFEERWLRKKAAELGCSPDVRARSLKLMEECLIGLGFENEQALPAARRRPMTISTDAMLSATLIVVGRRAPHDMRRSSASARHLCAASAFECRAALAVWNVRLSFQIAPKLYPLCILLA
jgi:hypothetical protein